MLKHITAVTFVALTLVLGGCASPAMTENMQVLGTLEQRTTPSVLREQIVVKDVTGGQETNPMWTSEVSSSSFHRALESSLQNVGLLAPIQSGQYQLVAHLEELDQPLMGLDLKVTANVRYTLVETASGKSVYERSISLPYTATVGDAFAAVKRLRLANEGAIRVNIEALINDLLALQLSK